MASAPEEAPVDADVPQGVDSDNEGVVEVGSEEWKQWMRRQGKPIPGEEPVEEVSGGEEEEPDSEPESPPPPVSQPPASGDEEFPRCPLSGGQEPLVSETEINDLQEWQSWVEERDRLISVQELVWDIDAREGQIRPLQRSRVQHYEERLLMMPKPPVTFVEAYVKALSGVKVRKFFNT